MLSRSWFTVFLVLVCSLPVFSIRGALFRSGRSLGSRPTNEEINHILEVLSTEARRSSIEDFNPEMAVAAVFPSEDNLNLVHRLRALIAKSARESEK